MRRNLKDLRTMVFTRMDWTPEASPEQVARVNSLINAALERVVNENPGYAIEKETTIILSPPVVPDAGVETLYTTTDAWRVQLPDETSEFIPVMEARSWDGWWIWLTDSAGRRYCHQIRSTENTVDYSRIWLVKPITMLASVPQPLSWWAAPKHYWLPPDFLQLSSAHARTAEDLNWDQPLTFLPAEKARRYQLRTDEQPTVLQTPEYIWQSEMFTLPGPTEAVTYGTTEATWDGPEPAGTFEYIITYCWGIRGNWMVEPRDISTTQPHPSPASSVAADAPTRFEPLWESPPSPASEEVTVVFDDVGCRLTLPLLHRMLGFSALAREDHTGWYIRIYRRRLSAVGGLYYRIESNDGFFLLAEVPANAEFYDDLGAVIPDMQVPLPDHHTYTGFQVWPLPAVRTELLVRYKARPVALRDDAQVPELDPNIVEAIVFDVLEALHRAEGNSGEANRAAEDYFRVIGKALARGGMFRPPSVPTPRAIFRPFRRGYRR